MDNERVVELLKKQEVEAKQEDMLLEKFKPLTIEISDAIEYHLEWAYEHNLGKLDSEQLAQTIEQVIEQHNNQ